MSSLKRKRLDASHRQRTRKRTRTTSSATATAPTHTYPDVYAVERKHSLNHVQTLSHASGVGCLDMRPFDDESAAILMAGLYNGDIVMYRSALSRTAPIQFHLLKRFHAHTDGIFVLHIATTKRLFVSSSHENVKIWRFRQGKVPLLVKYIQHPDSVGIAKFSSSGLLVTGCDDYILRVYGVEPLCSLCWSCKLPGDIISIAWSPSSNRIAVSFLSVWVDRTVGRVAASFGAGRRFVNTLRVWEDFRIVLEETQHNACSYDQGLSFVSDDLLLCSDYADCFLRLRSSVCTINQP